MEETQFEKLEPLQTTAHGLARQVSGEQVQFGPGLAGSVTANGNLDMTTSGVVIARAGKSMTITESIAPVCVAGGEMTVSDSFNRVMVIGGNARISESISLVAVPGGNLEAHNSFIGVSFAKQADYHEGSRVLLTSRQALILGAALGAVYAVMRWLLGRGNRR